MDIKKLHPIILIGEGLGEKYKALPIGEKKKVAILSDIEMSNICLLYTSDAADE